jgi:rRNA maturation protein Rpf1
MRPLSVNETAASRRPANKVREFIQILQQIFLKMFRITLGSEHENYLKRKRKKRPARGGFPNADCAAR